MLLLLLGAASTALADELPKQWFQPGDEQGGLVVLAQPPTDSALGVFDETGALLGLLSGKSMDGLAAHQYRLQPGDYSIFIGSDVLHALISPGRLTYVIPDETGRYRWTDDLPRTSIDAFFTSLSKPEQAQFIAPNYIEPATKALYFKAVPPGVRPPPNG